MMDIPMWLTAQHYCLAEVITQTLPKDNQSYCLPVWDGWGCWNYTLAGRTAVTNCPQYKLGFDPTLSATRQCNPDGTWWIPPGRNKSWSNYTQCVNSHDRQAIENIIYVYLAGYFTSTLAIAISLVIFVYFRQLSCDRITVHKNLFLSYLFNGLAWILYYMLAPMNGEVLLENPIWCQILNPVTQYFVSCNYYWMFCEGLYLHTIIVSTFVKRKVLLVICCIVGWGLPLLPTLVYAALRALDKSESQRCWTDRSDKQWVIFVPIIMTILVNLAFLCNIVRLLVTRLKRCNNPNTNLQTRRAARATLILIPLLGLVYILFPVQPPEGTTWEAVHKYASAIITSFQGLFVALIFCLCNEEVIAVARRKLGQRQLVRDVRRSSLYTRGSMYRRESTKSKRSNSILSNIKRNRGSSETVQTKWFSKLAQSSSNSQPADVLSLQEINNCKY